jgi:hypothetical protein
MRLLVVGIAALGLAAMVNQPVLAAAVHEGIVVRVTADKLTMTDLEGKNEHSHAVSRNTIITCDGKECRLEDLKKGFIVKVTTTPDEREATKIEARSQRTQ